MTASRGTEMDRSGRGGSSFATFDSNCSYDFCYFKRFVNNNGRVRFKCMNCFKIISVGSQEERSFDTVIKEMHLAKKEGREPVIKKRTVLRFT